MTDFRKYKLYLTASAQRLLSQLQSADMLFRNKGRGLVWLLLTAIVPCSVRTRGSDVRVIVSFVRFCYRMAVKSGVKYLVLYLKACSVLLQQSVGGHVLPSTRPLKAAVSRSRSGLPRCIPPHHRKMGRREIRLWMTLFGLYRVLGFRGVLSTETITRPGKVVPGEVVVGFQRFVHDSFFVTASAKYGFNAMLRQAVTRNRKGRWFLWTDFMQSLAPVMFPIVKSAPGAVSGEDKEMGSLDPVSTSLPSLVSAARTWFDERHSSLLTVFKSWLSNTGSISRIIRRPGSMIARYEYDVPLLPVMERLAQLPEPATSRSQCRLGKLSTKEEAAGKIRVFAMVDPFTQWALYPLHKAIMSTLRSWPSDGTFDQLKPVTALLRRPEVSGLWSYDLSAATDRLPVQFQKVVLQPILGLHGAEAWADILVKRDYWLNRTPYRYSVGQPMGAYSSWAMLALTHHALVQWAYYRYCARIGARYHWFELYAILGDDIIIGHSGVAAEYLAVMDEIGVEIGLAKSLVSPRRLVGEFAKRFFTPADSSMVPIKAIIAAKFSAMELVDLARKFSLSVNQVLTLAGAGYRVKGSLNKEFSKLGLYWTNLLLALSHPSGPLGIGLASWLQSKGWGRLGKAIPADGLVAFLHDQCGHVQKAIDAHTERRKVVFSMMMVKRDHGQRYNPYDWMYPVYDLILAKLDGYTYELASLEKELKALKDQITPDLSILYKIWDLERRLSLLPKPDNLATRPTSEKKAVIVTKLTRVWRDHNKCRTGRLSRVKSKENNLR